MTKGGSVINTNINTNTNLPFSSDALPAAIQPAGEAAAAEMVHADGRAGEKEGDPRHDDAGAAQAGPLLQLPAVERPKNRLQEVPTERQQPIHLTFFLFPFSCISEFLLWGV